MGNTTRYRVIGIVGGVLPVPVDLAPHVIGPLIGGAAGDLAILRLRQSAPSDTSDMDEASVGAYMQTATWLAHTSTPAWTEAEKGVLVPETDGTAAMVQAASATWSVEGGWEVCERLVLASETTIGGNVYAAGTYRLVRYTGTKPSALDAYPYLTAAGVAEAVTYA